MAFGGPNLTLESTLTLEYWDQDSVLHINPICLLLPGLNANRQSPSAIELLEAWVCLLPLPMTQAFPNLCPGPCPSDGWRWHHLWLLLVFSDVFDPARDLLVSNVLGLPYPPPPAPAITVSRGPSTERIKGFPGVLGGKRGAPFRCELRGLVSWLPPLPLTALGPQCSCFSQRGQQQPGEPHSHLGRIHWRAPGFLSRLQPPGRDLLPSPRARPGPAFLPWGWLRLC